MAAKRPSAPRTPRQGGVVKAHAQTPKRSGIPHGTEAPKTAQAKRRGVHNPGHGGTGKGAH